MNGSGHVAVVSPLKSVSPFATYQPSLSHPTQAKGSLSLPLNKADLNWSAQMQGPGAGKLNEILLLSLIWLTCSHLSGLFYLFYLSKPSAFAETLSF